GFLKIPQGSQHDRGIIEISGKSVSAPLGRSPPRSVCTCRIISPRFSRPDAWRALKVTDDKSGLDARNTWPPGTKTLFNSVATSLKNLWRASSSFGEITVNLGKGCLFAPSNEGGIRQTPPRPC